MADDDYVRGDMLKITEYTLLDKLPDPFISLDGRRIGDPAQWRARRSEISRSACELLYGKRPPEPEFLETETLCNYRFSLSLVYRITTGRRKKPIPFRLKILLPDRIEGNICFAHVSFGYSNDNILMKDVNIDISAGSKVAVVGPFTFLKLAKFTGKKNIADVYSTLTGE